MVDPEPGGGGGARGGRVRGGAVRGGPVRGRAERLGAWTRGPTVAVLVPVLLAVALTAWRYDAKPLWRDEIYTLVTAGRSLPDVLDLLAVRDAGLVVYYALMNPWLAVGDSAAWLRLPSAVATPVAVGLCAALGRRVGGSATALVAGVLAALAPGIVVHAQEARPYPLVLAATSLTALLLLRATEGPSRARWVVLAGVAVLAGALHPLVALPAVAGLFAAAWWRPGRARRRAVVAAGLPAALVGLALVVVGYQQSVASPPAPATPAEYLTFWRIMASSPVIGVVVLALVVVGAVSLRRRRRPREVLLLLAWAATPVAAVTVLGLSGSYFNARYATASVPALCVLAALGAAAVVARLVRRRSWGVAVVLLAVVAVQAPPALAQRAAAYSFDDAPGAAAEVAAGARPGDVVVYAGPVARPLVSRYLPPGLVGERLDDVLLVASPEQSDTLGGGEVPARDRAELLAGYPRVWLVGTRATATNDLARRSWSATAVATERDLLSRHDHGYLRVELWASGAGAPAPAPVVPAPAP